MSLPSDRAEQEQLARDAALAEAERLALAATQEQQRYDAAIRAIADECANIHKGYSGRARGTELREVLERLERNLEEEEKRLFPKGQLRDFDQDQRFDQYREEIKDSVFNPFKYLQKGLDADKNSAEPPVVARGGQTEAKQPEIGSRTEPTAVNPEPLKRASAPFEQNKEPVQTAWPPAAREVTGHRSDGALPADVVGRMPSDGALIPEPREPPPPPPPHVPGQVQTAGPRPDVQAPSSEQAKGGERLEAAWVPAAYQVTARPKDGALAPEMPEPPRPESTRGSGQLQADTRPDDELRPDMGRMSPDRGDDAGGKESTTAEVNDRAAAKENENAKPKSDRQARMEAVYANARAQAANRGKERGDDDGGRGMDR